MTNDYIKNTINIYCKSQILIFLLRTHKLKKNRVYFIFLSNSIMIGTKIKYGRNILNVFVYIILSSICKKKIVYRVHIHK